MSTPTIASTLVRDTFGHSPHAGFRAEHAPAADPAAPRRLNSKALLEGEREVEIEHAGAVYRLRRTSLGKLILTK